MTQMSLTATTPTTNKQREQMQRLSYDSQELAQQEVFWKGSRMSMKKGGIIYMASKQKKVSVSSHLRQSSSEGGFCRQTMKLITLSATSRNPSSTTKNSAYAMRCGRESAPPSWQAERGQQISSSIMRKPWKIAPRMTNMTTIRMKHRKFLIQAEAPSGCLNQLAQSVSIFLVQGPLNLLRKILDSTASQQFLMNSFSALSQQNMKAEQVMAKRNASRVLVQSQTLSAKTCSRTKKMTQGMMMLTMQPITQLLYRIQQATRYPMQFLITFISEKREQGCQFCTRHLPSSPPWMPFLGSQEPYLSKKFYRAKTSVPMSGKQPILKCCFRSIQPSLVRSMFMNSVSLPSRQRTSGLQRRMLSSLLKNVAPREFLSGRENSWKTTGSSKLSQPYLGRISLLISKNSFLFLSVVQNFYTPSLSLRRLYSKRYIFSLLVSLGFRLYFRYSYTMCSYSLQDRKFSNSQSARSTSSMMSYTLAAISLTLKYLLMCFNWVTFCRSDMNFECRRMGLRSQVVGLLRQKSKCVYQTSFLMRQRLATRSKFLVLSVKNRQMWRSATCLSYRIKAFTLKPQMRCSMYRIVLYISEKESNRPMN